MCDNHRGKRAWRGRSLLPLTGPTAHDRVGDDLSLDHPLFFVTPSRARNERMDATDKAEPIQKADPKDPIEPTEQAEPTEPIESTEPLDAIERNESSDQSDHFDVFDRALAVTRRIVVPGDSSGP